MRDLTESHPLIGPVIEKRIALVSLDQVVRGSKRRDGSSVQQTGGKGNSRQRSGGAHDVQLDFPSGRSVFPYRSRTSKPFFAMVVISDSHPIELTSTINVPLLAADLAKQK